MKTIHPIVVAACALASGLSPVLGFQDPSARNNKLLFDYIDTVSETVSLERFESIPFDAMMSCARQFGQIERRVIDHEAFFEYVKHAVEVREAFQFEGSLSDRDFENYVLPLRIRYESTANHDWRPTFREEFSAASAETSPDSAARLVLNAISERIHCEPETTYTLPYRGDLDPLTTWRGKRGDEIDVSILACAALRSIGIPARLVYTPAVRGTAGGKVWLEYMQQNTKWEVWAPTLAARLGQASHRSALSKFLAGRTGVIFANPADPKEVTESYVRAVDINLQVSEADPKAEPPEYGLAFEVNGLLQPIRGMELLSIRSTEPQRTVASDTFWSFQVERDIQVYGKKQTPER